MRDENDKRFKELRRLIKEGIDSDNIKFDFGQLIQELDRTPGKFKGQIRISDDFDAPMADAYVCRVLDAIERNLCDEMLTRHTFAADLACIDVLCGLLGCDALDVGNATARHLIAFEAVFRSLHLGSVAGDASLSVARDWLAARAVDVPRLCRVLHGGGRAEDLTAILYMGDNSKKTHLISDEYSEKLAQLRKEVERGFAAPMRVYTHDEVRDLFNRIAAILDGIDDEDLDLDQELSEDEDNEP